MNKKSIVLDKDYTGPEMLTVEKIKEAFKIMPRFFMPKIRDWIEKNNEGKTFKKGETITIPSNRKDYLEAGGNELKENAEEVISEYQYDAWTLTKDGRMHRGSTGYFKDENGLYILKDGRRLSYDHLRGRGELGIRIGAEDAQEGLNDILKRSNPPLAAQDSFSTLDLLRQINTNDNMADVAFQAFQINLCYTKNEHNILTPTESNIVWLGSNTAFFHTGEDEMGVPIVVTRIGNINSSNILIIAGPHGDERNAQRLILWSQIKFSRLPWLDWLYYFIPCISPTAAFADIRGFPRDNINSSNKCIRGYNGSINSIDYGNLLYDISKTGNKNRSNDKGNNIVIINTNRDCVNQTLISTEHFMNFLDRLKDHSINKRITSLFIHGYDRSGRVYSKWENIGGKAYASYIEEAYKISNELFGYRDWKKEIFCNYIIPTDEERIKYVNNYSGEYVGPNGAPFISFDIELMAALNEGKPEDHGGDIPSYESGKDIRNNLDLTESFELENGNDEKDISEINTINIRNKFYQLLLRLFDIIRVNI